MTNIQVWAFNEFTTFDRFADQFGVKSEAELSYDRREKVKMISTRDHKLDVNGMLAEMEKFGLDVTELRGKIFRKDGGMRKVKEVRYTTEGLFLVFKF